MKGARITKAAEVRVGDIVWHHSTETGQMEQTVIQNISHQLATGLYNPHVLSGTIVVDGVAALTFTESLARSTWAHAMVTAPAALSHSLLPSESAAWLNAAILQWLGI